MVRVYTSMPCYAQCTSSSFCITSHLYWSSHFHMSYTYKLHMELIKLNSKHDKFHRTKLKSVVHHLDIIYFKRKKKTIPFSHSQNFSFHYISLHTFNIHNCFFFFVYSNVDAFWWWFALYFLLSSTSSDFPLFAIPFSVFFFHSAIG